MSSIVIPEFLDSLSQNNFVGSNSFTKSIVIISFLELNVAHAFGVIDTLLITLRIILVVKLGLDIIPTTDQGFVRLDSINSKLFLKVVSEITFDGNLLIYHFSLREKM